MFRLTWGYLERNAVAEDVLDTTFTWSIISFYFTLFHFFEHWIEFETETELKSSLYQGINTLKIVQLR